MRPSASRSSPWAMMRFVGRPALSRAMNPSRLFAGGSSTSRASRARSVFTGGTAEDALAAQPADRGGPDIGEAVDRNPRFNPPEAEIVEGMCQSELEDPDGHAHVRRAVGVGDLPPQRCGRSGFPPQCDGAATLTVDHDRPAVEVRFGVRRPPDDGPCRRGGAPSRFQGEVTRRQRGHGRHTTTLVLAHGFSRRTLASGHA